MSVKKGQELELKIIDLAVGGKGVAREDGFAIFVDQTAPLDRVIARIIKKKKNYAEARIVSIIEPSPFRVDPPCAYSGYCGGCKLQFMLYDKQLVHKRQHVVDCLERIGQMKQVCVHETIASKLTFGYRNKMEFSCSDARWLLPDEMGKEKAGFALGLHVPGTFYKVLDIEKCLLQPNLGNEILNDIREFIKKSNLPVYGLRSHTGFWRFVMLRHSVAFDNWMVNLVTSSKDIKHIQPLAEFLIDKYPKIISVVNNINSRKASVAIGESEVLIAGVPYLIDKIGDFEFEISANSFFQTNTLAAKQLYNVVKEYAQLSGKENVVDLYSGTGTIAIYLANFAKQVIGIELIQSAVTDAENNCQKNGISNCRFIDGDIKECLPQIDIKPDVMIIDPPRVGMHKDVVKQILEIAPDKIVYVSCNPATMARDVAMMKETYKIVEAQPIDMFPHTHHIESVIKLVK